MGKRIDNEVEDEEDADKKAAKERRKDSKKILKDLEKRLKPFGGKSLKRVKGDEARLQLEKLLWIQQEFRDRCKANLVAGNSPECVGQVESMFRDMLDELRNKRHQ